MYNPSESEKEICYKIVREYLMNLNANEYDKIVDEIIQTTYSIGGDFGEHTLREVANIIISNYGQ